MMVNEQLLRNVIKRIEREAASGGWDQDSWGRLILREGQEDPSDAGLKRKTVVNQHGTQSTGYAYTDMTPVTCGTSFCLAGHTILEAGETVLFPLSWGDEDDYAYTSFCLTEDNEVKHISTRASELLGVPEYSSIFDPDWNDLDEFKAMVTRETGVELD